MHSKQLIIGGAIVAMLVAGYFISGVITSDGSDQPIQTVDLGPNFTAFMVASAGKPMNFNMQKVFSAPLIGRLQDFSQTIGRTTSRGRDDPFKPYASSRSVR